jgi:dipeptidyl-peptidase-4
MPRQRSRAPRACPRLSIASLFPVAAFPVAASLLAACAAPSIAIDEERRLTLEDIYHPDTARDFSGSAASGFRWLNDTHYLWPKSRPEGGVSWLRVEAATGRSEEYYDGARMASSLAALDNVTEERADSLAHDRSPTWNDDYSAVVLNVDDELFVYTLDTAKAVQLTDGGGKEELATFSPDGTHVAFVRDHDLFVVATAGGDERRLTADGSDNVLNGKLDWLYQEEIYGRGRFRAFWWSPDSTHLAFLRLDQTEVPRYTIVDDMPTRPKVKVYPYPKAGDPNPTVGLGIVKIDGGAPLWTNVEKYKSYEPLIVEVGWAPDGERLTWQVQDREQRWLELNIASRATGSSQTLLRETTPAWVDRHESPRWLEDGSFLWFSERTGWKHLYHYRGDGTLVRQVTTGEWEVRTLHGVDETNGWVYLSGTAKSPIATDVYRVRLDTGEAQRLSAGQGTHSATFSPSFEQYIDRWSNLWTPPQVRVCRSNGDVARLIDGNPVPALDDFDLSPPELVQVETPDGFVMEAMLIRPPNFDPARRYPVYQHTYAGPHAPMVRNRWAGKRGMYWQLLAQQGIVVWVCDNRTASGKGAVSAWPAYQRLVETELQDIESGLDWLRAQPWVDQDRIGINGWSYGGLMVSYALTHSKSFCMGIAGGSVTDWRNYDSIYTERFMRTPDNNPEGYASTAPQNAAADLHGELLLIHGALDDNVHPQNTMQFAYELQKAGKPFELMLYPKSKHGVADSRLVYHMNKMMLAFIHKTLLDG